MDNHIVNGQSRTTLPPYLFEVAIGNRLGDRSQYTTKTKGSKIKLEQGRVHKDYLYHLFELYKGWTNYEKPYRYIPKVTKGTYTRGVIKSYSFRIITHPAFNEIYDLFICNGKKTYKEGQITNHLIAVGLSYCVRDDGSLQKNNEIIQRTMGFTEKENIQIVKELNRKFRINSKVVCHKKKHQAIYIPASDARTMCKHLVYLPDSMKYKMPLVKKGHSA